MIRLFPRSKLFAMIAVVASSLSFAQLAHSQSADGEKYNFAGFASFVYAKGLNSDSSDFNGGTMTEDGEYRDFNKLGLRLDVDLGDNLSFATQAVMRGENDYDPDFDWIYLSYDINPNLKLSIGKTTIPLYMFSDYLDTSYAYQWIEPPHSVYGSGTVKSTEGLRLSWRASMGGLWSSYLTVWGGDTNESLAELDGASLSVDNGYGLAWEVEREWLTLRAVYFGGTTSLDDDSNIAIATDVGIPNTTQLYDDIIWKSERSRFLGLGIGMDFQHIFLNSEITQISIDGNNFPANELNSWYAMIGTRLPAGWSISLTYAGDNDRYNKEIGENAANELGPLAGASIDQAVYEQQRFKGTTYTLGSRWNFHPQASLKMEYLTAKTEIGSADETNPKAFRLGVDLVF